VAVSSTDVMVGSTDVILRTLSSSFITSAGNASSLLSIKPLKKRFDRRVS